MSAASAPYIMWESLPSGKRICVVKAWSVFDCQTGKTDKWTAQPTREGNASRIGIWPEWTQTRATLWVKQTGKDQGSWSPGPSLQPRMCKQWGWRQPLLWELQPAEWPCLIKLTDHISNRENFSTTNSNTYMTWEQPKLDARWTWTWFLIVSCISLPRQLSYKTDEPLKRLHSNDMASLYFTHTSLKRILVHEV
jgi:hypothetical protein